MKRGHGCARSRGWRRRRATRPAATPFTSGLPGPQVRFAAKKARFDPECHAASSVSPFLAVLAAAGPSFREPERPPTVRPSRSRRGRRRFANEKPADCGRPLAPRSAGRPASQKEPRPARLPAARPSQRPPLAPRWADCSAPLNPRRRRPPVPPLHQLTRRRLQDVHTLPELPSRLVDGSGRRGRRECYLCCACPMTEAAAKCPSGAVSSLRPPGNPTTRASRHRARERPLASPRRN